MTCGVYAYQDNIYNKIVYIGASKDCERRNQNHYAPSAMKKQYINYVLQNDIDNRYSFIILLECSEKDLYEKELALIKMIKPEYNYKSIRDLGIKEKIAVSDTQTGFYPRYPRRTTSSAPDKFEWAGGICAAASHCKSRCSDFPCYRLRQSFCLQQKLCDNTAESCQWAAH